MVNRWVGVVIAMVGTVVVAPSGTRLLLESTWRWLRQRVAQVRAPLARLLPFLRRHQTVTVVSTVGTSSAIGWATLTASGRAWTPTAPVDERIEALRQHIAEVEARLNDVSRQLREETTTRERVVAELEVALKAETAELRRLLEEQERRSARIDARGLPVIAVGVFLSGVPDELAGFLYPVGWLWPTVGVGLAAAAVVPAWRETHRAAP